MLAVTEQEMFVTCGWIMAVERDLMCEVRCLFWKTKKQKTGLKRSDIVSKTGKK